MRLTSDSEWAASTVAGIPRPWAARLLSRWEKRRASFDPLVTTGEGVARRKANEELLDAAKHLRPMSDELPLDASDHDVCNHAWEMAERCRAEMIAVSGYASCIRAAGATLEATQRMALAAIAKAAGIVAPGEKYADEPAVMRLIAAHWWRGQLRKAHAKAVERAAIGLNLVAKDRECYVSSVGLESRRYQNERNAATLENTIAKNVDTEQEFTLAQLAAKGTANKSIRRAELMTRINGFERIAIAAGHAGLFLTITCPSKMHRRKVQGSRTVENGKWDGTTPDGAQAYLSKVWARIRAALARRNVSLYGFRIAEPQHDGTPHWHCLFFYDAAHDATVRATVRRYALAMDGDEPGAQEKRCDFKRMDPAQGTAAGYIAKYVAKNIDGYKLEKDLYGNDSLETSARVEAWASRWRIRQFQQIGGPPVTVWRELRRVESVPSDAPGFVVEAHNAVNKIAVIEGRDNASVAWDRYVNAQGGVACGRGYRVRIARVESDKIGRYGETGAPVTVGVEYFEVAKVRDAIGNWIDVLPRTVTVESRRYEWQIMRPAASAISAFSRARRAETACIGVQDVSANSGRAGHAGRGIEGLDFGLERAQRAPWTCVNNCTGEADVLRRYGHDGRGTPSGGSEGEGGGSESGHFEAVRAGKTDRREVSGASAAAYRGSGSDLTH